MSGRSPQGWNRFRSHGRGRASGAVLATAFVVVLALGLAQPVSACPVCYGAEGSDMANGMNNGIMFLLGVVALVQIGFVSLFGSIWYRTRKLRKLREQFHLIEGDG